MEREATVVRVGFERAKRPDQGAADVDNKAKLVALGSRGGPIVDDGCQARQRVRRELVATQPLALAVVEVLGIRGRIIRFEGSEPDELAAPRIGHRSMMPDSPPSAWANNACLRRWLTLGRCENRVVDIAALLIFSCAVVVWVLLGTAAARDADARGQAGRLVG